MGLTRRKLVTAMLATSLASTSVSAQSKTAAARSGIVAAAARRGLLASVSRWGYQLARLNFAEMAAAPFDLLVTSHAVSNGVSYRNDLRRDDIALMQSHPDGRRRLVVAYLSIGEAEHFRHYWNPEWLTTAGRPVWLGAENPLWPLNYPVDFWHPDWQRIVMDGPDSLLGRILAVGFDGIYLDRADVFQELTPRNRRAQRQMADFIARLSAQARQGRPEFLVILQNAEELIREPLVRDAIDAIAKEDLYFGIDHKEGVNTRADIEASERDLLAAKAAGKRIFTVEYLTDAARIAEARERALARGFVPYFGPRLLNSLVVDPMVLTPSYRGPLVPQESNDP